MKENEQIPYVVEREFLSKISVEELLPRIIRSYLQREEHDGYEKPE